MRIGFDAKRAFNNRAGLGNYSRNVLKALFCYYPDNQYFLFTPYDKEKLYFTEKNQQIVKPDGFWKYFSSMWRSSQISKEIINNKIEIYHGLSHELPLGITRTKAKSVVTIHDLIFLRYPEFYKKIDRRIYLQKFKQACLNADKIIAISEQTKADIINFFSIKEEKIKVIYQPINQDFFSPLTEEKKQKIQKKYDLPREFFLYVGTIEERKNLLSVVKAMYQENINYPLFVVGKATVYLEEIKNYITEKSLKNIVFLHKVDNEELKGLYTMAKLLVYPSIFEGFGLPVAEAQACGTPVITSNLSSLPEAAGKAGVLINPKAPEAIGKAILQLYNDDQFYEEKRKQSFENAQRFTFEKTALELYQIYKQLVP